MIAAVAFAIFGALLARHISPDPEAVPAGAVLAAMVGWLSTAVLRGLLVAVAGQARRQLGAASYGASIRSGLTLLVPFALLAAVAELGLGWHATDAFVAAGVTGSSAAAASAAIRVGGRPLPSVVAASLWSLTVSAGWMWLWTLGARVLGGAP